MKAILSLFVLRRNWDSLAAGIIGFFIIYLFTRHSGIGLSPDSVTYLSVARNLHHGKGLIQFDQTPLVDFPAFYPFFLNVVNFMTGLDALVYGPVMNALMFALVIYTSGAMMNGFAVRSGLYKFILLSCIVLSPCLLEIYPMLWTETLFLVFVLFYILFLNQYFRTHGYTALLVAALFAALACVTRYAGVTLIATGGMLIIFDHFFRPGKRFAHLLLFCSAGSSLLIINLLRNRIATGVLTGIRQKGVTPLMENIYYYGAVLCDWLPLPKNNYRLALAAGLFSLVCFGLMVIYFLVKKSYTHSIESIAISFGLVYIVFILASATISRYQQLNSRLLSPLFIPFIWATSCWMTPFYKRLPKKQRGWMIVIIVLAVFGFQHNQLAADYETYDGVKDAGVPGYTEDPFPQSQIVRFIQHEADFSQPGFTIYSNGADAVYLFTGRNADLLPQKVFPDQVNRFYTEKKHYLIWFNEIDDPDEPSLHDILANKKMVLIRQFADGAVYITEDGK